jgi:WS/DGAT/MGAT family acyltransferase
MNHLSGLDATFLHVESPEMPMHIGSLNVVRLPEGYAGDFYEDAKAHVAKRLHLADVFTRKLALMPFDLSNPVWVDDEDIDLDYHMRHVTLPKPGSNRQLQQYVARLHSSLLDRSRPLWEFFIIDGLKSGEVALYTKVHHAGIDGQAGAALATAIFDLSPTPREVKAPRQRIRRNQYQLGMAELAGAALRNTANQYVKLFRLLPALGRAARDVVVPPRDEAGKRHWKLPKGMKLFGPRTLLNTSITNQRSFAGRTVPLAEVKQIAKAFGVSLNDVVMGTTAGALRRYLKEYDDLPDKPLLAAVPVSLREAGDASANNQVSMITMTLATDIADPVARLKAIQTDSAASKAVMGRMKTVIPTDFPMFGAPWLISGAASLLGRSRLVNIVPPIANLIVSNVQGAPMPLYFAGAELTSYYPVSIPAHGMALNVTVQSYNGRLDYGLIACRRVVPDVADIGDFIVAEHKKLMELMATELAAQAAAAAALPAAEEATTPSAKPAKAPRAPRLKLVPESANPAAKPVPKARAVSSRPRRKAASA